MPEKWQCHCHHSGPMLFTTHARRIHCAHPFRQHCKTDNATPSTLQRSTAYLDEVGHRIRDNHSHGIMEGRQFSNDRDPFYAFNSGINSSIGHNKTGKGLKARPPVAGWWVCHNCRSCNNPALAPDACSICGHYRCGLCTAR